VWPPRSLGSVRHRVSRQRYRCPTTTSKQGSVSTLVESPSAAALTSLY
jgi:hypothetical protein